MDSDFFKICVTVILAVLGWLVGHYFTSKRNILQKRRDISIEYLIIAYRTLTTEISHREETKERSLKLENILSDIQLFGSEDQIILAQQLADVVASGGTFELDPLINSLRDSLRTELKLSKVKGNVKWLRFNNDESKCC